VKTEHHDLIRSTVPTSHGFIARPKPGAAAAISPLPKSDKAPFVTNFEFIGTIDNAPYLCVPAAIEYRRTRLGGEDAVRDYLFGLARRGGQAVSRILGTETLENEEGTLGDCAFANVRLPLEIQSVVEAGRGSGLGETELAIAARDWMARAIVDEYDAFIALMWYGGAWWARLSAQVYLELSDFERGGRILLEVSERATKGEFLKKSGASKL
jgi:hypothetical protein